MNILILGSTGYVGGRLVPRLADQGYHLRCLVRDRGKADDRAWPPGVEIIEGDVLEPASLEKAMQDIEVIYYLIHSMAAGEERFENLDRTAAANVAKAASAAGVKRIIYLGGLGKRDTDQSPHLRSRHEVGNILREGPVPVTEFRAAVIVGSGSISFEMIHHLVNRLPVMICPRWVYTLTQPIAIADVLRYLVACPEYPESAGQILDIGGPKVLSYRDMMLMVARVLGLRRWLIRVPVLTPRLSSYWVNLVTPIPAHIARALIEGLRYETVCENDRAREIFDFDPISLAEAIERAVSLRREHRTETTWTDAASISAEPDHLDSHLFRDRRRLLIKAPAETVYGVIRAIGGENGWYYANWLWSLRGFIDKQLGGVGLRRGRRHPEDIKTGDALDFWRVMAVVPGERLLLRAEMKVWGQAWLELKVEQKGNDGTLLTQTASYYPRGLIGHIYWYTIYPIHTLVFRGLVRAIADRAEMAAQKPFS